MTLETAIASLHARQIFDSRGRPTVEVEVTLRSGASGRASAPSGASTGRHEAHELRDGDPASYQGRGVSMAVENANRQIASTLIGADATDQARVDALMRELDGTVQLSRLGANAVLATSLAVCRASARAQRMPLHRYIATLTGNDDMSLPMPMVNMLSGGAHAAGDMDLQDFLAVPIGAASFAEALQHMFRVRQAAHEVLGQRGLTPLLADEGGVSPGCKSAHDALDLMVEIIEVAGFEPGRDIAIAIDVAASEFFSAGQYELRQEGRSLSRQAMIETVLGWVERYPIRSIEDPLQEDDWDGWTQLTVAAKSIQVVGDDLFATNVERMAHGVGTRAANAVLIKPNQNGTLSGTLDAIALARRAGYATIVSARSGETDDAFIADLAVGTGAGQIKIGSVRTAERMAKYNRLLRIAEDATIAYRGADCLAGTG